MKDLEKKLKKELKKDDTHLIKKAIKKRDWVALGYLLVIAGFMAFALFKGLVLNKQYQEILDYSTTSCYSWCGDKVFNFSDVEGQVICSCRNGNKLFANNGTIYSRSLPFLLGQKTSNMFQ